VLTVLLATGGVAAQDGSAAPEMVSPTPASETRPASGNLAALFPKTLRGRVLEPKSASGAEWIAQYDASTVEGAAAIERMNELVAAAGKTLDDLRFITALDVPSPGNVVTIAAVQLDGARPGELLLPAVQLLWGDLRRPVLRLRQVLGRDVILIRETNQPGTYPVMAVATRDIAWIISADVSFREEIVAALPLFDRVAGRKAVDLASVFPYEVGGEARTSLYIQRGWHPPVATSPTFDIHGDGETIAVEMLLTTGASSVTTASGGWFEKGTEGPRVTAYQMAGAAPGSVSEVLHKTFLPRMGRERPPTDERQIAGKDVLVLVDEGPIRNVTGPRDTVAYIVGDTIWWIDAKERLWEQILEQLP
jgi:hypothetical protein